MKIAKKCHVCGEGNFIRKIVDSFQLSNEIVYFKIPCPILECDVCGEILVSSKSLEQVIEE